MIVESHTLISSRNGRVLVNDRIFKNDKHANVSSLFQRMWHHDFEHKKAERHQVIEIDIILVNKHDE